MSAAPGTLSRMDRWAVAYARAVVRGRFAVLALALAAVGAAAAGAPRLQFRADYRYNFGENNPQLAAFETIQSTYTKSDNVLFVVAPRGGDVFAQEVLEAVHWLTEESWQLPYSIRVDSVTNFQHTWADGDDLIVEDLVEDPGALDPERRARVRAVALAEPLIANRLVAADAGATGVNVTIQGPDEGGFEPEVTAAARVLVASVEERYPNLEVALTGVTVMSNSFDESAKRDLSTLVPVMYGVLIVTMVLFLRSLWGALGTLLVAGFSAASAMGIAGWIGIPLTPPSATAPTITLTIAIAAGIHILVIFARERREGRSKDESIVESLRLNWEPVFLTSLTTVIGFLSLNFSDAPPFRDLGNITAIGVCASWIFSVTFLPAFVAVVPYRVDARRTSRLSMEAFAEWLIEHKAGVFRGMVALVVVVAAFIPRIELNDMFVTYFGKSLEFRRDTDFATEKLSGIYLFHYSVESGSEGGINDPAYLAKLEEFAGWLREQPEVNHVSTLTDTMKRLNKNMHADRPEFYRLPTERELAAQYLLLYEFSLPYGLDLNNQINVAKSATKVTVTIDNVSARELRAIDARAQQWLADYAPRTMQAAGASTSLMFANISHRNIESMVRGTLLAFVLISLILMISLRSLRLGLLSFVPNLVPTILAFGIWGIFIREVGMAVATVTACSLGIIVDATVHFFSKYLRARREQSADSEDAVRYALSMVGSALWISFLILMAGFFVLAFSSFRINAHFGLLVAISIGAALLADFLLLPTLLMRLDRHRLVETEGPEAD